MADDLNKTRERPRPSERSIGRGGFLGVLALGGAGLFFGKDVRRSLGDVLPEPVAQFVPSSGWRIYTIADRMPDLSATSYQLQIAGLVDRPMTFSLADLYDLPRVEQISDFYCVTGWSVEDVHWAGVRLRDVLEPAGVRPEAAALRFVSAEVPYDDWLTFEQAALPDVLLAFEMDRKPLRRPHGAPVRLVVPQMYGYKSVKWVTRIEVAAETQPGFWEERGYDADAWVGGSNGIT